MKTPIMRPPLEAVLFGFERIGMVIRIAWLPIVLCIVLYAGAFALMAGASIDTAGLGADPEAALEAMVESPGFISFYVLQSTLLPFAAMLILTCVYVAVTRASTLSDYEPPRMPFYFALGPREVKYFITRILYTILIAVVSLVILGVAAGAGYATYAGAMAVEGQAKALVIAPGAAVCLWLILVWLWVILRFLPVLPIAAVENRIAFGDAWKMTAGNFWRLVLSGAFFLAMLEGVLFIFLLAVMIPATVVLGLLGAFGFGVFGPAAFAVLALLGLVAIPAVIAVTAFSLAAEAAFPARVYAYLTDCGEACKIY